MKTKKGGQEKENEEEAKAKADEQLWESLGLASESGMHWY